MGTPLTALKGVGPKTEELFRKLSITSQEELLRAYPREYDAYSEPVTVGAVRVGEKNAVLARIPAKPGLRRFGKQSITILTLQDATGKLQVNWFHMPYLRNTLQVGRDYVFRGTVLEKNGRRILQHPALFAPEQYAELCGSLRPIYALTAGLSNQTVTRTVRAVLEQKRVFPDPLPETLRQQAHLCDLTTALFQIHFPKNAVELQEARRRLAFEEFFFFQLGIARLRSAVQESPSPFVPQKWKMADLLLQSLPYCLTNAQERVWNEVRKDLEQGTVMHRLIQGDVGSGKTILAFLAMVTAVENGWQSVLMAPTEVLAEQHATTLSRLCDHLGRKQIHFALLTGSSPSREKKRIQEEIAAGQIDIVIGTHALFQESVSYARLGLVVTDEQHRFGVRQRAALQEKGKLPHVLVMSATPIPRTLARIVYGDLDISILDEVPATRQPVKNAVVGEEYREKAYRFLEKEAERGHQGFVICPMIEPNEELSCADVQTSYATLQQRMGQRIRIGLLHGQMGANEKQQVMKDFAAGNIQVLVSTTVVEVGVDIPNATVMLIENAERFGLAQLHQLRGRVGRGEAQSYCIFLQGNDREETRKRLEILGESNDGFHIAEEDLRLRGPGDLFGTRQSGLLAFALADVYRDASILQEANEVVQQLLQEDPQLSKPAHAGIRAELEKLATSAQKEYDE